MLRKGKNYFERMRRLRLILTIIVKHDISSLIDDIIFEMSKVKSFLAIFESYQRLLLCQVKGKLV